MLSEIKDHKGIIACIIVIVVLTVLSVYFYLQYQTSSQEAPKVVPYSETEDPNKIKTTLDVDSNTATQIVKEIRYIHDGQVQPEATYYVQAPTIQKAADNTAEYIKKAIATKENPKNLPVAAVEKTDRTVVTADTDQQKVDVYKINLRNNHKIKAGIAQIENRTYEVVAYQAGRFEGQVMTHGTSVLGGAALYTLYEW